MQRKVKQRNDENSNLLMQVIELIIKNYDLAQSLQMKIVKDPSVRPAPGHPPVMECTTIVTVARECTNIQNQQTPKQNQQNPRAKINSGDLRQGSSYASL